MDSLNALHITLRGFTASFRHPLLVSGTQLSTPVPAYSNLLGMISACAGRAVSHTETRVGFEFHCRGNDLELERTVRWQVDKKGNLKPHSKGQGISKRQVYLFPELDLYVTNLNLRPAFESPAATPCFGRSQDIAWIVLVREIELHAVTEGAVGATLLPLSKTERSGLILRLPEWLENTDMGRTRCPGPFGLYSAIPPTTDLRFVVRHDNLYHPSDAEVERHAIYLHRWIET